MYNETLKSGNGSMAKAQRIVDELENEFGLSEQNEILLSVREMLIHRRSMKVGEMTEQIKSLEEHIRQIA
jgi:hypothetical protein